MPATHLILDPTHSVCGSWLRLPRPAPVVAGYRLRLDLTAPLSTIIYISADPRYEFFLAGQRIARGPARSEPGRWRFDSFLIDLPPGTHWLAALVWDPGDGQSVAQMGDGAGFLLQANGEADSLLSTGAAPWQVLTLDAYSFEVQQQAFYTGTRTCLNGARLPWGWSSGEGAALPAAMGAPAGDPTNPADMQAPRLVPATLPPQRSEVLPPGRIALVAAGDPAWALAPDPATPPCRSTDHLAEESAVWQQLLSSNEPVRLPANCTRRVLIDLGRYATAFPRLTAVGAGTTVRLRFAEALFIDVPGVRWSRPKGRRDQWQDKHLRGLGPCFVLTTEAQVYEPLWWESGRWLELCVTTGDAPAVLHRLDLVATGYPFDFAGSFSCDDAGLVAVAELCRHTLRVGTHETYTDCPYYEQLQYIGDTRLEALATYATCHDDALPRQAISAFAASRDASGFTSSRWPSRQRQTIPPFSLWWIGMLHDHAQWRGDAALVRQLLPDARGVLEAFLATTGADGLVAAPPGWNFVDWVPGWAGGMPPGAEHGVSAILNWQAVLALRQAAELETAFGDTGLAERYRARADLLVTALEACWDAQRGRYRDALGCETASEHTQALALIAGVDRARHPALATALADHDDLARATIYFTHYILEAWRLLRRGDRLHDRLAFWRALPAQGFTTTPETPEPSRSDCHPWGAHPLYHLTASVAGIRPAAFGFTRVHIAPLPGALDRIHASVPHPRGMITLEWTPDDARIALPPGVSGTYIDPRGGERSIGHE